MLACLLTVGREAKLLMLTYKDAGVNIDAGDSLVTRIQRLCAKAGPTAIGGFAGLYPYGQDYLVACTDGVGTKLKLAFAMGIHDTIGQDLVAMCVNDLICCGARPLFFLDYFASSSLDVDQAEAVLRGIINACNQIACPLLGGETAELPGFYHQGEYDLSGFAVGTVAQNALIDGSSIQAGDCIFGLTSSGIHSNGFTLARRIPLEINDILPELNASWGHTLLTPTRLYVNDIDRLKAHYPLKGIAHITGGGLEANIQRILPQGLLPKIFWHNWTPPAVFRVIQERGPVATEEMRRVFNMGIGMAIVVDAENAKILRQEAEILEIGEISP